MQPVFELIEKEAKDPKGVIRTVWSQSHISFDYILCVYSAVGRKAMNNA